MPNLTVTDIDNIYPTGFSLTVLSGTNYTASGNTITPLLNFNGTFIVPVKVNDGGLDSNIYNLTVTVNAINDTPTTTGISNVTVNEDSANTVINLLTSFSDIEDGTGLTYTVQSNTNSSLVSTGISGGNLTLSFTANANGTANITVRGTDSGGFFAETTFTVTVNAVNDNPTTTGISNVTVNEDAANTVINLLTSFNDTERRNRTCLFSSVKQNSALVNTGISGGNLTLSYTANANGTANITVRGTDSGGFFAETTFTVTVNAVNDNPTTTGISNVTVNEDSANTVINLLTSFNDVEDGTGLVYSVQANTNPGLVSAAVSGGNLTLSYAANGNGTADITVRGTDTGGLYAETAFTVTVNAGDDNPVTAGISNVTVNEDSANTVINLLTSFNDTEDGTGLTYTVQSNSNSSLVSTSISGGNLTLSYTANGNGTSNITVRGTDTGGLYAETAFAVTVNPVNDPPVISAVPDQSIEEDTVSVPLIFTVSDNETPAENLTLSASSSDTALVPTGNIVFGGSGANRTVTLTPVRDGYGQTKITLTVRDGELQAETSFMLTVGIVTYQISGQITYYSSGIPISGVILTLISQDDPAFKEITETDSEGRYTFPAVRSEKSYICTPSKPGIPDLRD